MWLIAILIVLTYFVFVCIPYKDKDKKQIEEQNKKVKQRNIEEKIPIKEETIMKENKQKEINDFLKKIEITLKKEGEGYMLDPNIYELIETKIISREITVCHKTNSDEESVGTSILFEIKVKEVIEKYKKMGYIIEVGNITSVLLNNNNNFVNVELFIDLILYKSKEQLKQEEERINYLKTIEEYNQLMLVLDSVASKAFSANEKPEVKEVYKDLKDKIEEELTEANKEYDYKSQEYKDYLKAMYKSFKKELDRLNKKYK